jgi:hypothetical protein
MARSTFEYTVDGDIRTIDADNYRTEGEDIVFTERYRNPGTGEKERDVVRVAGLDKRDIHRLRSW